MMPSGSSTATDSYYELVLTTQQQAILQRAYLTDIHCRAIRFVRTVEAIELPTLGDEIDPVDRPLATQRLGETEGLLRPYAGTIGSPAVPLISDRTILTRSQCAEAHAVLKLLASLHMGHLWCLVEPFRKAKAVPDETIWEAEELLHQAATAMTGRPRHLSWGIRAKVVPKDARIAWDMHQLLLHRLSYDENPGGELDAGFSMPDRCGPLPLARVSRLPPAKD